MSYKYKILLGLTPTLFLFDFITKWLILHSIPIGKLITVIPGFFDLVHVRNTGAAFGLLANMGEPFRVPFFYGVSGLALIILFYCFKTLSPKDRLHPWPLSLVLGGVLGNLLDRIRFGSVIDFVSLHVGDKMISGVELRWPAFNVADSAITIAMILLIANVLKGK